jgi:serine protease Do
MMIYVHPAVGLKKPTREGTLVKRLQRGASIKTNTIGSLALSLGALILLPLLSATETQSSKQTASGQTKRAVVDNAVDSLQQFSTSMERLSKRVSPSVVQIFSTGYNLDTDREHNNTNLFSRRSSSGSGIIIAADGWIVTNAHVVEGSRRIRVRLNQEGDASASQNGRSRHALLEAKLVLTDRDTDLAFLKVDATSLPTLELSDSSELRQGQVVLAFGSPLGLDNSVSMGVVSSVARQLDPDSPTIYVQTDAAINPGNSGGPLVNTGGYVVGVNTLILTQSGGNEGIGLAIPSNVIRSVYNQVRREGHVHHHGIGMSARNITPALASGLGLSREDGVLIEDVIPQSSAQNAGLMPGDIVLSIDKKPVQNIRQLALGLYSYAVGEHAKLEIQRGQEKISYEIPVVEKEDVQGRLANLVTKGQNKVTQLGILALTLDDRLLPMLPPLRNRCGVVVAARESEGAYIGEGPLPGDVIYSVNGTPVDSVDSLRSTLDVLKTADAIVLQVERLGSLHYLVLETDK